MFLKDKSKISEYLSVIISVSFYQKKNVYLEKYLSKLLKRCRVYFKLKMLIYILLLLFIILQKFLINCSLQVLGRMHFQDKILLEIHWNVCTYKIIIMILNIGSVLRFIHFETKINFIMLNLCNVCYFC